MKLIIILVNRVFLCNLCVYSFEGVSKYRGKRVIDRIERVFIIKLVFYRPSSVLAHSKIYIQIFQNMKFFKRKTENLKISTEFSCV